MCNRFRSIRDVGWLRPLCTVMPDLTAEYNPNVAPTNDVPIIRSDEAGERILTIANFGIAPKWVPKDGKALLLTNARVETIFEKQTFRRLINKRRCVIPAEGYYEWRAEHGRKQPYLFTRRDDRPLFLAGLWDETKTAEGIDHQFLIITGQPNSLTSPVHDRMPCIINDDDVLHWLDPRNPADDDLIIYPSDLMQVRPVNTAMNRSGMKDVGVIDRIMS